MNKLRAPQKRWGLCLFSALMLVLTSLSPIAAPVYATANLYASVPASHSTRALPSWWSAPPATPHTTTTVASYRALPAWWPTRGSVAAPRIRPLAASAVDHFAVSVPASATAGQNFSTTITAQDGSNQTVGVTVTVLLTTTNGGEITPTSAPLVSGTWTGNVSLTTAGSGRTVRAVSDTITGQATLTILPAPLDTFTVTPDAAQMTVGASRTFTATGSDQYGNRVQLMPAWTKSAGEIASDATGLTATAIFTAPTSPASVLVTATQSGKSDGTSVTVVAGELATLTVTPDPVTIGVGLTRTFTATGTDQYGNRVPVTPTWDSDVGTFGSSTPGLTATVVFNAQTVAPDSGVVTATQGSVNDTAAVNIVVGPLTTINVTPDPVEVIVGETQPFSAAGADQYNNPVPITPSWDASYGSINPTSGLYTAPTVPGTGVVTATDGGVNGTADVTVIHGPVESFLISSIGTPQTAGANFNPTITARDEYNNPATRYNGTADLDDSTGTIAPTSISFSSGSWTGPISITKAATGVSITATRYATTGYSNAFTVVPAPLDHIVIRSQANGAGDEVTTEDLTIYETLSLHAAGYDQYDNYRQDYTATWSATSILSSGDFSPNPGSSTTFTPAPILSGSGTINATYSSHSDDTGVVTVRAPLLVVKKVGPSVEVPAGTENMEYTIVYTNVGSAAAQNVRITDTYDENVTYAWATSPNDHSSGSDVVWTESTLPVGVRREKILLVDVSSSLDPGTILTNVVEIAGLRVESDSFLVTTQVTSTPDLTVSLSDLGNDPILVGDTYNLQVVYANSGTAPVYDIVLTLTLDSNVTFQSATKSPIIAPSVGTGNVGRWEFPSLGGPGEDSFFVTIKVADYVTDQYSLRNRATIQSKDTAPAYATEVTTVDAPALAMVKSASPNPAIAFNQLDYTLVYSNVGHAAASALQITDAVPDNTSYVSCQPAPCSQSGGVVTWQPGGLGIGQSRSATMRVNVQRNLDTGTLLTNHARVYIFATPDYSASAQIETSVVSSPSLQLSISNGQDSVQAGDDVTYILNYENVGSGRAYSTTIVATPPSLQHVSYVECWPPGQCSWDGSQVTFDLGTVDGGDSGNVRFVVHVYDPLPAGARSVTASAVIHTVTPGDPTGDNSAQDVDDIATHPDLFVLPSYQGVAPYPGKRVTYTVQYSNAGHIATEDVIVRVTQPPNSTFEQQASVSGWVSLGDGRHTYAAGDLDYDEGGVITFVVTLTSTHFTTVMTNFNAIFEIYDSGISGEDGVPGNNVYQATLGVPNLVIESVQVEPFVWGGQPGFMTVTVRNTGTGPACGVYNPSAECSDFALDPFLDPATPPASYPLEDFGDCYAIVTNGLLPGVAKTAVFSFTLDPFKNPNTNPGYCWATPLNEIWLKVDNWKPGVDPYPDEFGLVPEFNEFDNVFGPVTPPRGIYLPLVLRNYQ